MKKLISLLLVLLLAVMPALSLADAAQDVMDKAIENGRAVKTVIQAAPGALSGMDESLVQVISDLCAALDVTTYEQKDQAGFSLGLSGTPAVTFDAAVQDGTPYLASNLLGSKALRLNVDDLSTGVNIFGQIVVGTMVESGEITAEEGQQMLDEVNQQLTAVMSGEAATGLMDLDLSDLNLDRTLAAAMELAAGVEEMTEIQQPEGCDPAVSGMVMTMTAEQIQAVSLALLEDLKGSASLMGAMDSVLANADAGMTMTELLDQMEAELENNEALKSMEPIVISVYLGADEELVALISDAKVTEDGQTVSVQDTFTRQTQENGVQYTMTVTATPDDDASQAVAIIMTLIDSEANTVFSFVATEGGNEVFHVNVVVAFEQGENAASTTCDIDAAMIDSDTHVPYSAHLTAVIDSEWTAVDASKIATYKLYLNGAADEVFTLTVTTGTTDAMPAVSTENAVTFATMTMDDIGAWLNEVVDTLQMALIGSIQLLPESVLMLLIGQ